MKGVHFFGPHSEYIVSGSECGNIFFWDKSTEAIVQCIGGDENWMVREIILVNLTNKVTIKLNNF
jgi:WD repeat-containing protein 42A